MSNITLQINTTGAWRTVCEFDESKRSDVMVAVRILHAALDGKARWCTLTGGQREWLHVDQDPPSAVLLLQDDAGIDPCDFSCQFVPHQRPDSPSHAIAAHLASSIIKILTSKVPQSWVPQP